MFIFFKKVIFIHSDSYFLLYFLIKNELIFNQQKDKKIIFFLEL